MSVNEKMTAIADAIRAHTGGTEKLGLDAMAKGIAEVHEAGRQAEYDRFWDAYQLSCDTYGYENAFSGRGWTNETFRPKHDLSTTGAYMIFRFTGITDLKKAIEDSGISFTIKGAILQYTFNNTLLEVVGGIAFAVPLTNLDSTFHYSSYLREIQTLPISESATNLNGFVGLRALETISFSGTIPVDLTLKDSPKLSKASITNIVNTLSATAAGKTLTLSKTAVESAFGSTTATEWTTLISTKSNWTISLV